MSKYMTSSKSSQISQMQHVHNAPHSGPDIAVMATHEDIARRAYEIYVDSGCREGQSEQNWHKAEQELKYHDEWLQADKEIKTW